MTIEEIRKELLEKSDVIRPANIVPNKNDCLGSWRDELQRASNKAKFEKCREHRQTGYLCDAHPTCDGCDYELPDDVYVSLGGKLRQN